MISFFIKFYVICGLVYVTVCNTEDTRTQRAMMRGRPEEEYGVVSDTE
jgi:hypothetical protein